MGDDQLMGEGGVGVNFRSTIVALTGKPVDFSPLAS